jgi:hypothetical protein
MPLDSALSKLLDTVQKAALIELKMEVTGKELILS